MENKYKIILSGNANVGKSTLFNYLTGLKQHTGNWTGKTVSNAKGYFKYKDKQYEIIDIPGTYSLNGNSEDEIVARDYICFNDSSITIIVCDATAIERNLALFFQISEIKKNIILCINLLDEANKKGIKIDLKKLEDILGVCVVGISAKKGIGIENLLEKIDTLINNNFKEMKKINYDENIENAIKTIEKSFKDINFKNINKRFIAIKLLENEHNFIKKLENYLNINFFKDENILKAIKNAKYILEKQNISQKNLKEKIYITIYKNCENIYKNCVKINFENYYEKDIKIDKILTCKKWGIPIMILMLCLIFFITIIGANYPSQILSNILFSFEVDLKNIFSFLNFPNWLILMLVDGIYKVVAWVVAVMLPPMAIFFPIFAILEDLGYLPRVAFNLDKIFKKCDACGKQALTMAMGFGCNSVGIVGCRIIDSKRERLIAILTNNFVPCNGRFPTIISIISMFFVGLSFGILNSIFSAIFLTFVILLSVFMTFFISKILSKTILKGVSSNFTLELPPYRKPNILNTILRSFFDKTLYVLGRAIIVSIPAGIIIFLMANTFVNGESILFHTTNFLNPIAKLIGLDGVILMAFILGFPANEIVMPIALMAYLKNSSLIEIENLNTIKEILIQNGWTINTAICTILFCLFHWPCSTTCLTIKKETNSFKWTILSFLIPTFVGIILCGFITFIFNIFK